MFCDVIYKLNAIKICQLVQKLLKRNILTEDVHFCNGEIKFRNQRANQII
jgi:hypothetical protein